MVPPPPLVRHGQTLSFVGLQNAAAESMGRAGLNMTETAERVGVSVPAVSRALGERGTTRDARLLMRIVAAVSDYDVEDVTAPAYRLVRRGND